MVFDLQLKSRIILPLSGRFDTGELSSTNCGGFLLNSLIIACTTRPRSLCTVNCKISFISNVYKCYQLISMRTIFTFNNPGALVISLCSLHHLCVIGGETLSTGFSSGNSGDNETIMAIRLSPASNCTWYSTSSCSSKTLKNFAKIICQPCIQITSEQL